MFFSLFCFLLIFFSNNILKIIIYFLGSLILLRTALDSWYNYFIILTYLGGLFILIVYMATLRFNRESFSPIGLVFFLFLFFSFSRMFFENRTFFLFVRNFYFFFLCLVLTILLFMLFFISFLLPSGIRSRGRV